MLLHRLGTPILLLLAGISFAFVYALNVGGEAHNRGALYRLVNPVVQSLVEQDDDASDQSPVSTQATPRRAVFVNEEERDGIIRRTLVVGSGETLTSRLVAAGVTRTETAKALDAMRGIFNPHKVAPNQRIVVLFKKDASGVESFTGFELRRDTTQMVSVSRAAEDSFKSVSRDIIPEKHRFAMRATVQDGVYESGLRSGIPASILNTLIKSYSYAVDFQRDIKPGDRMEVLYEQATDEDNHGVGDPTLIYAALQVGGKILPLYRVAMPGNSYEYFNASGESIKKSLLKTPVEGAHLTSLFGMRLHPILGFSRMHKGVDFGAPAGAPIFAAGAGIVEDAGMHSGYGRYIRIRHTGHLSTAYAHLKQFGRGITRGARVSQGDVIGYVGSSGYATGPHLHYEVLVDNNQVDPTHVNATMNASLTGKQLMAFQDWRGKIHSAFEQLVASNENAKPGLRVAHNTVGVSGDLPR